jgi:hypothetical protein
MRNFVIAATVAAGACCAWATTLQQLSFDDLILKSTVIVRGTAKQTTTAKSGSVIFTHYQVQVTEQLKGVGATQIDIVVPGGMLDGARQSYAGSPAFTDGQEHFFFLWTSRSGLTQVMGLTQGAFDLQSDANGNLTVVRAASAERMLDPKGNQVIDQAFSMPIATFRSHIAALLSGRTGN